MKLTKRGQRVKYSLIVLGAMLAVAFGMWTGQFVLVHG